VVQRDGSIHLVWVDITGDPLIDITALSNSIVPGPYGIKVINCCGAA